MRITEGFTNGLKTDPSPSSAAQCFIFSLWSRIFAILKQLVLFRSTKSRVAISKTTLGLQEWVCQGETHGSQSEPPLGRDGCHRKPWNGRGALLMKNCHSQRTSRHPQECLADPNVAQSSIRGSRMSPEGSFVSPSPESSPFLNAKEQNKPTSQPR